MMGDDITKISIIIPMYNEADNLPMLYESIGKQIITPDVVISEVIAVDNGSSDTSVEISKQSCTHVFSRPDDTIADLRNYGARHSSGDILIFMDADCVLGRDVVMNVVSFLKDSGAAAVGPDGLKPIGNSTWVQNTWYFHTRMTSSEKQSMEVDNLSSGFFAIRADAFSTVGGFDGSLSVGEDTDISRKLKDLNHTLIRSSTLNIYNSGHPATIRKFMKREYWHGDSFRHILIHKKLEPLTLYFFVNAFAVAALIVMLARGFYGMSFVLLVAVCSVPLAKAVKKAGQINSEIGKLFFIYLLYVNSRSAALFKIKG